jgi:hypothetical protein
MSMSSQTYASSALPAGFELIDTPGAALGLPEGFELEPSAPPIELDIGARSAAASAEPEGWGEYAGGLGLKAAQGLTFSWADELAAAIGSLAGYDREELLEDIRDAEKAFTERHPTAAGVAEVGGALASGIGTGVGMVRAFPALGRLGGLTRAATTGAVMGAPVGALSAAGGTEGDESTADAALYGAVSGGAWGGGLGAAGNVIGRTVGPWASEQAQRLRAAGIRLTPGELLGGYAKRAEDTLTSAPFVGALIRNRQAEGIDDLNRAAVREALAPDTVASNRLARVIDDTEVGHDLVTEARDQLTRRYNEVVPRMSARVDNQLQTSVVNIANRLPASMRPELRDAVQRHLDRVTDPATSRIDGRGLQDALGGLRDEGRRLITSQASRAYDRDLGEALLEARDALIAAARRSTPTRAMTDFDNVQRAFAGYSRIRDAASRTGADQGTFTPAQLMAAVRSGDKSAGKGATATGTALLQDLAGPAKSVMTRRVSDSGTPERAALLAAIAAPAQIPVALAAAAPLAALYTPIGRAAFERLAAGSPQTRAMLRQLIERMAQRAAPGAAAAFGG